MTVVSVRHKIKFYLVNIVVILSLLALGSLMPLLLFKHGEDQYTISKIILIVVFSGMTCFTGFYSAYVYWKNVPIIRIDCNFICFNKEIFSVDDLEEIIYTGKKNFPYLLGYPMEAASLRFKNGQIKYIYDDMYENSWKLKTFLKQVVINKRDFVVPELKSVDSNEMASESYDFFIGNQFMSFRGVILWGLGGFIAYRLLVMGSSVRVGAWIVIAVLGTFWFLFNSWLMHYFKVSSSFLVVKNHNLWWRKKVYQLSDIEEVVFETHGKMPDSLRVITKDFRYNLYPAGTLRDNTWLGLKDKLEMQGVKVRNELPDF
jgi:hypothetical protein